MDEATARIAYPLIEHVLCLRDRLENGEFLEIDFEQTALKDMLRDSAESPGGVDDASAATAPEIVFLDKEAPQPFFGIRYALVCWLDEFLGRFSSWVPGSWQENTLERALFGSNDGSWKFWEQARLAEERGLYDALGVFYLSVMLGFRGSWPPSQIAFVIGPGQRGSGWRRTAESTGLIRPSWNRSRVRRRCARASRCSAGWSWPAPCSCCWFQWRPSCWYASSGIDGRSIMVLIFLTWIRNGLGEALWPAARDRQRASAWTWPVHGMLLAVVLVTLAYLNHAWDLERSLRSPWPVLHRAWLPALFVLSYAVLWLLFCLGKLLSAEPKTGHFPDIDASWTEAVHALKAAQIDLRTTPVYLVLGRPAGSEEALFEAAGPALLPPLPGRKESPLHVHACKDGVYVTCAGASLMGRQASHLLDTAVDNGFSWSATGTITDDDAELNSRLRPPHRDLIDLYLARLRHVCRLLAGARQPSCPVNGILLLVPLAASNDMTEARKTARLCHFDLQAIRAGLRVDCPIDVLLCDLEKAPGCSDFFDAIGRKQAPMSLACRFPLVPDLEPAESAEMVSGGIKWLMQSHLQNYGYSLLRLEDPPAEQAHDAEPAARLHNEMLISFLAQMHARADRVSRLVTEAIFYPPGSHAMIGGFFMAATGDAKRGESSAAEAFQDLTKNQRFVSWTADALAEDHRYRLLSRAILAAALLLGGALLTCGFLFL